LIASNLLAIARLQAIARFMRRALRNLSTPPIIIIPPIIMAQDAGSGTGCVSVGGVGVSGLPGLSVPPGMPW
jgi:hypothetical protein